MRFVALIVIIGIIYFVYARNGEQQSPQSRIAEAQREAAAVQPSTPQNPKAGAAGSGYSFRAPIDRAKQALELSKQRTSDVP